MTTFSALEIGRTGVGFAGHWMDTVAHNLANINTVTATDEEAYRAIRPVATALGGGPFAPSGSGVAMGAQVREEGEARLTSDPNHPLADENGMVQLPLVDTSGQMVDMIIAQRHYQTNMRTVQSAREAYQTALRLGAR